MDEGENNSSFDFSSLIKYIPVFLGGIGIILVVIGIFLTLNKKEETSIIIKEENSEATFSGKLFVDIEGAVIEPGVYEVSLNGRVKDALILSGGLSSEADRDWAAKNLNLAAKLVDGMKIYIPKNGEILSSKVEAESLNLNNEMGSGMININNATLSDLDTLSGVGPVTAQKIINGRPYQKIEDLIEKKIVGNSVWEKIKNKIVLY